jgi:pyruvate ferredoxin oxidoreductase alpha subunit
MRSQLEGSMAVARAVALCRPEVISAYPISPQTHIVEALSDLVRTGDLEPCEYLMVESEFAALSAAIGASATGARSYTATASQGLLYMAEALYNASGLGLPIVMTVANRAIGAPINIWNDHSDAMSQRDSGWIQLYAESNQDAIDLHVQAFRLAEELSLPVMVCMDGFVLTHAIEPVELPSQEQVDAFLPPFEPRQVLDPEHPVTIGAMVGPEAFAEVKYLMHAKQMQALDLLPEISSAYSQAVGRATGGLVRAYRSADADTIVVALGSVLGTVDEVVDELREQGVKAGAVGVTCFRPYPLEEIRAALGGAKRVVVLEKAFAVGLGGILGQNVRLALSDLSIPVYDAVAGLGGRPITRRTLHGLLADVLEERLEPNRLAFLDLDWKLVERELQRVSDTRRSGPHAENILRDVGAVAAGGHGGPL